MKTTASADGTRIAFRQTGSGPPLVLVHGILSDHSRFGPLLPFLEPHATIFAMDRRGRGASGDHAAYDAFREFEDIAALVDSVADATGAAVTLYGHSSGAAFALNAAVLTPHVRRLVLYEPAISGANLFPTGLPERLEALLGRAHAANQFAARARQATPRGRLAGDALGDVEAKMVRSYSSPSGRSFLVRRRNSSQRCIVLVMSD